MNYLAGRLRSIRFACQGIRLVIATQANARFHLLATLVVLAAAYLSRLALAEWAMLMLAIGAVWTAEALNTAIEFAVDLASPEQHQLAERAKDAAAGGVLLASIFAALVGLMIFLPRWL